MEDAHAAIGDLSNDPNSPWYGYCFFAVYDGHGGGEVAQFAAHYIPELIKSKKLINSGSKFANNEDNFDLSKMSSMSCNIKDTSRKKYKINGQLSEDN